jgi:two-component system, chemotaxis family, CheB/CheR fusion protein
LQIAPRAALALSMAIHELCTNAGKYGALSNDAGEVSIDWQIVGPATDPRFVFTWKERGGPITAAAGAPGFGTRMIETALGRELGGSAKLDFPPTGAVFTLDVPAENIVIEEPASEESAA